LGTEQSGSSKNRELLVTQTAAALFLGPTDPLIPMLQVLGRRVENQHRHPLVSSIPCNVVKALAHRTQTSQIMVLAEQLVDPRYLGGNGDFNADLLQELLLGLIGQSF
jgi:hypothetical protein